MFTEKMPSVKPQGSVKHLALLLLVLFAAIFSIIHLALLLSGKSTVPQQMDLQAPEIPIKDLTQEIITTDVFTWVGRLVPINNAIGGTDEYQLVRVDRDNQETVIDTYLRGECDEVQWNHRSDDRLTFKYLASPCEAFVTTTELVFNDRGEQLLRLEYQSDSGQIQFQAPHSPVYSLELRTSHRCADGGYQRDESFVIPQTELYGITLTQDGQSTEYNLPNSVIVDCAVGYGEFIMDPYISDVRTNTYGSTFNFMLPNAQAVGINLREKEPDVIFY